MSDEAYMTALQERNALVEELETVAHMASIAAELMSVAVANWSDSTGAAALWSDDSAAGALPISRNDIGRLEFAVNDVAQRAAIALARWRDAPIRTGSSVKKSNNEEIGPTEQRNKWTR